VIRVTSRIFVLVSECDCCDRRNTALGLFVKECLRTKSPIIRNKECVEDDYEGLIKIGYPSIRVNEEEVVYRGGVVERNGVLCNEAECVLMLKRRVGG